MKTLNCRLKSIKTDRLPVIDRKAGTEQRQRGRALMETRRRIMARDGFRCAHCGRLSHDHEVDHRVPLERGGTNDDDNLQLLCSGPDGCHARKTANEAKERWNGSV